MIEEMYAEGAQLSTHQKENNWSRLIIDGFLKIVTKMQMPNFGTYSEKKYFKITL